MKNKIGIIDVGGGLRDIYGAGIFDYLLDNQIYLPYSLGISAGSANVASYTSRQRGRNKVFYEDYSFRKDYISFHNFVTKGSYIDLDYVYGTLSNEGGENPWDYDSAMKYDGEMVVAVSNAETGKQEYFYKKDFKKNDYGMLAASSCVPIVCKEYNWRGKKYYDGGISNPIPVEKAYEDGCSKVIVILTRPVEYRKTEGKDQVFYKRLKNKYPIIMQELYDRPETYNSMIENLLNNDVKSGKAFIVAPDDDLNMKMLEKDKNKLETLYQKGYNDGAKVKEFIIKNS